MPELFVAKWSKIQQKETAVAQSHFNDVCHLVGHPTPLAHDPSGQNFSFETQAVKPGGRKGFADVFYRGKFIWEYKGPHKDLDKAYQQLQLYREALENPPLLITSDIHTIIIHTNFNNYPRHTHTITFDDLLHGDGLEKLRWAFFDPNKFRPERTQTQITHATADTFLAVADAMKQHLAITGEAYTPEQLSHFLLRLLFCLFVQDLGLLPARIFSQIIRSQNHPHGDLRNALRGLFREMRHGGNLIYRIYWFDGTLFDDEFVPTIPHDLSQALLQAAEQDWSAIDPSIFGTLFERVIDESKRAQLGAHYTGESDIMLIVEPVLMAPWRRKWDDVRRQTDRLLRAAASLPAGSPTPQQLLADFAAEIAAVRVLDPACGSGNFLYVALRQLLDLQKQVIAYATRQGLPEIPLTVSPQQLYGLEVDLYAHELAQVTVWIGYLQWRYENGFAELEEPLLRPLPNIRRLDAILAHDEAGSPSEPTWPEAEIIIGNPPFLGGKRLKAELGSGYVDRIFQLYAHRVAHEADLVCYWFEKARGQLEAGIASRVGLIATNSIRGGPNRRVLDRIKQSGDIFMAWSDRAWVLKGAAVRVSMVGFDNGQETNRFLDGKPTRAIYPNLANTLDLSQARRIKENEGLSFMGVTPAGPFDIDGSVAQQWLGAKNKSNHSNADVVRLYFNGNDLTKRPRNVWIVDFGVNMPLATAKGYELPFKYVAEKVYPVRQENNRAAYREKWWILAESRPGMRRALKPLSRYLGTSMVAKHRFFQWLSPHILPANLVIVVAREDDYFFGILHSRVHTLWALRLGTWLGQGNNPRYTPTTTFETFPFPWPPGQEPAESEDERVAEIAYRARVLHQWRDAWQNPPPLPSNVIDVAYEKMLNGRSLINLYNSLAYYRETTQAGRPFSSAEFASASHKSVSRAEIQGLDDINTALDRAVLNAYGWPHTLNDEELLERLLALNLSRTALYE